MKIDRYSVFLFNRVVYYGSRGNCFTTAQMFLWSDNRHALLIFYDPQKTPVVPTNTGGTTPVVFIPREQYPWHVDLLRHESPIDFADDDSKWWFGSLRTAGSEPVGEGE